MTSNVSFAHILWRPVDGQSRPYNLNYKTKISRNCLGYSETGGICEDYGDIYIYIYIYIRMADLLKILRSYPKSMYLISIVMIPKNIYRITIHTHTYIYIYIYIHTLSYTWTEHEDLRALNSVDRTNFAKDDRDQEFVVRLRLLQSDRDDIRIPQFLGGTIRDLDYVTDDAATKTISIYKIRCTIRSGKRLSDQFEDVSRYVCHNI